MDEWPPIDATPNRRGWTARMDLPNPDPMARGRTGYLRFTADGDDPDEAVARVERSVIEELAVWPSWEGERRGRGDRRTGPRRLADAQ